MCKPLEYSLCGADVQVLEGKDLPASDWAGTCDPYVELQYDQRAYSTRTLYNSQQPLWNETFVFLENSSLLTRCVCAGVHVFACMRAYLVSRCVCAL